MPGSPRGPPWGLPGLGNRLLRTHKLRGDLGDYWAFRVDDDLRVPFRWDGDTCFLVAMGTHDEVY